MAGQSLSAWFLRFLATFTASDDRRAAADTSREQWLGVFVESFRGERATEASRSELQADVEIEQQNSEVRREEETPAESYRAQPVRRTAQEPRYRQVGGEDQ